MESSEKDRLCLKKITTPPLAYDSLSEREPELELVLSDCRADYLGIRKDKLQLKLDFWKQD